MRYTAYKSQTQPLCRACGKPIKKRVDTIYVYKEPPRTHFDITQPTMQPGGRVEMVVVGQQKAHVPDHVVANPRPQTKTECQRLTNFQVVSVSREDDGIRKFGVWDGESYEGEFFCSGTCVSDYAYMCVRSPNNPIQSVAYADARKRQREKGKP